MRRLVAVASLLLVGLCVPPATAASPVVRIRETALDASGASRLVVSVAGLPGGGTPDLRVTEAGRPVAGVSVQRVDGGLSIVLALDVSGSMAGRPMDEARRAVHAFVGALPPSVRLGLVTFGQTASVRSGLGTDRDGLLRVVDGLRPAGETAMRDAIALAATEVSRLGDAHAIVAFTDGRDTVSRTSEPDVTRALAGAKATLTGVLLASRDLDAGALDRLSAANGGRVVAAARPEDLTSAFGEAARDATAQYALTYTGSASGPGDLAVSVVLAGGPGDEIVVVNPRRLATAALPVHAMTGLLASGAGLAAVALAAFASIALLGFVLIGSAPSRLPRRMPRALRDAVRAPVRDDAEREDALVSTLARRAVDLVDRVPKPSGFDAKLRSRLERAGWPLRASELLALQALCAVGGFATGIAVLGHLVVAFLFGVVASWGPRVVLAQRIRRRQRSFMGQLPQTLQLLAGSLRAGYGLPQALDTAAKEAHPPTSVEFSRALSEARLGEPMDKALGAVADRLDSEDFRWVVMAVEIQRQVGGSLGDLLESAAATLREREQIRRQVKVLSAEGRLSAVILGLLPFALAAYLSLVNPQSISLLAGTVQGRMMIGVAMTLMGIGAVWMRRVVRIKV